MSNQVRGTDSAVPRLFMAFKLFLKPNRGYFSNFGKFPCTLFKKLVLLSARAFRSNHLYAKQSLSLSFYRNHLSIFLFMFFLFLYRLVMGEVLP